jgi:hypothetical protein
MEEDKKKTFESQFHSVPGSFNEISIARLVKRQVIQGKVINKMETM